MDVWVGKKGRTACMLEDSLGDGVECRLGVIRIGYVRESERALGRVAWARLTEEGGENRGCFLCLAWEGKALDEIARARGDTRRAFSDERGGLDPCALSSPSELVQHRHGRVQRRTSAVYNL